LAAVNLLDLPERLQSKIVPEPMSGCWLWMGALQDNGYGSSCLNGRQQNAHRVVYRVLRGEIPGGLVLDHKCRTRCCVNPDHLEPVTARMNSQRGLGGARNAAKTHCPKGHEYTPENTRVQRRGDVEMRSCRACERDSARKTYRKAANSPGWRPDSKTHCADGHEYPPGSRVCKPCSRRRALERYYRKKGER
jgi:hypothetical protein